MRTYFGLTAIALVIAALCGAALSWDGSVYLFQVLDKQAPFVPHNRLINVPLHLPVLLASRLTSDLGLLRPIFGLSYVAVPLVALALCWWVVRERGRALFAWAALGIGLGTLPGQFIFVSEANIAVHLFWPVVLAILVRMPRKQIPLVLILTVAAVVSHPTAMILVAFASALAFTIGLRFAEDRRRMVLWGAGFGLITALAVVRFLLQRTAYEQDQMSWAVIRWTYDVAMAGVPIKALASSGVATLVVLLVPVVKQRLPERFRLAVYGVELICLLIAAAFLLLWVTQPQLWRFANKFVFWAPFISICFMGVAAIEALTRQAEPLRRGEPDWSHRLRTIQVVASAFLVVISVQSLTWARLGNQLRQTMEASAWDCISTAPLGWVDRSPLNQFATPYYSVLLQGREPQKIVLTGDHCTQAPLSLETAPDSFVARIWTTGWFDFSTLGTKLEDEQTTAEGCMFFLSSGWYNSESDGPHWWRWSDGRDARINVVTDKQMVVELDGSLEMAESPDRLTIVANGTRVTNQPIDWRGMAYFGPIRIDLKPGVNVIQLMKQGEPADYGGRAHGLAVAALKITPVDPALTCERRP
jgi:hypothetical protein